MNYPHFDPTGELPTGTVLLEASAGTGKTFTIVGLATRYLAEGVFTIDQLLLVTFTRLATSELRTKLYDRLLSVRHDLENALDGSTAASTDPFNTQLLSGDLSVLSKRLDRVRHALNNIDQSVITTTDGFCSRMLSELGLQVDHDLHSRFSSDDSALAEQVITDLYLKLPAQPAFSSALEFGKLALKHPHLPLIGAGEDHSLEEFMQSVRAEFSARKRKQPSHGFSDLVDRLLAALQAKHGKAASGVLAQRFPLVMVDEFQDTDPRQWEILQRAFHQSCTLVLIGDPKQAIYGFRGADVNAYLTARDVIQTDGGLVATLSTNYRTSAPVVAGIQDLFESANLGSSVAPILVQPVDAAKSSTAQLVDGEHRRVIIRQLVTDQKLKVSEARPKVLGDVVGTILNLLSGDNTIDSRQIVPNDIAILVRTNQQANTIQSTLREAGIPTVLSGTQNVFFTEAAADWQLLLDAMAKPELSNISRVSTTNLVGLSLQELAQLSTEDRLRITTQIRELLPIFETSGIAGVFENITHQNRLFHRLLGTPEGERVLTDLRHLSQELQAAQLRNGFPISGLADWLREQRFRPTEEKTRRLESDRDAVQIMTIHSAKGLEFPVVLLPFAADTYLKSPEPHESLVSRQGRDRVLVLPPTTSFPELRRNARDDALAEELRLFYVAATRAQSLLYLWWAPHSNTTDSPLHRLLFNDSLPNEVPGLTSQVDAERRPSTLQNLSRSIAVQDLNCESVGTWRVALAPQTKAIARSFTRIIDQDWRRTSYSGLTSGAHGFSDFDEPNEMASNTQFSVDELAVVLSDFDNSAKVPVAVLPESEPGLISPMAELAGGTRFGTVVHAVYEACDPGATELETHLLDVCEEVLASYPLPQVSPAMLSLGLLPSMQTSLGELTNGASLAQLPVSLRLPELDFELPIGNRGLPRTVRELAALFSDRELVPEDDPLAGYGSYLAATPNADQRLSGFLTGSIDAVYRLSDSQRYLIFDYKTNRLPKTDVLRISDYHPRAMAEAMIESHYPLQALLYSVALHRFLGIRLDDYSPDTHLGGVGYLFVRGMSPGSTPPGSSMPYGVFTWYPSTELVLTASEVLAGGAK